MLDPTNEPTHRLSIEQLLERATTLAGKAGNSMSADISHVQIRACLDIAQIRITQADQTLRVRQIELTHRANELSEVLIANNRLANEQSGKNAESMNKATQELANSTNWLKWATGALVLFTAVQAFIAFVALYKK